MYLHQIKETFEEFKKFYPDIDLSSLSKFIVTELLPKQFIDDRKYWIFVVTQYGVYKVRQDKLSYYTQNENDCLSIKLGKGVFYYLNIDDVVAVEVEKEDWEYEWDDRMST